MATRAFETQGHKEHDRESDPIAIIGMSCRFSGMADTPGAFWQMLSKGMTSWSRDARDRFKLESFWHPRNDLSGSFNASGLHLLRQNPAAFDNDFFSISGLEAKAMDPQQRLMLELAYETFENAGLTIKALEKSKTGVEILNSQQRASMLANRISYFFDLRGPSMTIDTACSSTLVAIHEACSALRMGEIDQALIGGVNLILDPDKLMVQSSMQFLSPDGRCYSFDARASGYSRGEGVAGIMLKPLSKALKDRDTIRAILRGTSVVSDGKTLGITMPSMDSQVEAITRAYEQAGLVLADTTYIEAHGTGTIAGDKAEALAFTTTIGKDRREKIIVGSVKSNLGHIENASGLASVIKTVLMIENGVIPPVPTFEKSSEQLPVDQMGITIPREAILWPAGTHKRASINSTGYGGTTCHAIVEAPPKVSLFDASHDKNEAAEKVSELGRAFLFVFSHHRGGGIARWVKKLKRHLTAPLQAKDVCNPETLAFTLGCRRSHFAYRTAIVAYNHNGLCEKIEEMLRGSIRETHATGQRKICFIFTGKYKKRDRGAIADVIEGQGAQWARMGYELLSSYPVFAHAMMTAEAEFQELGAEWKLISEIGKFSESSVINEARIAQPASTALQIALVDLLTTWGVRPAFVCGHSSGEIAAAYAAGILTRRDALRAAYFRGSAIVQLRKLYPELDGGMLAVGLPETAAKKIVDELPDQLAIACINSPSSVTISGDRSTLCALQSRLNNDGVFNRLLAVDVAYHSHHVARVYQEYLASISDIRPKMANKETILISSVKGQPMNGTDMDSEYWVQNLVLPVRFSDAITNILSTFSDANCNATETDPTFIIEVGPHGALEGPVKQTVKACGRSHATKYASALTRNQDAHESILKLAGEIFSENIEICLRSVNHPIEESKGGVLTGLPPYQWFHDKLHWQESRRSKAYRFRHLPRHDLLGVPTADSIKSEPTWRNYLRSAEIPWLKDHCIGGQNLFPGAGYITMVIEALREIHMLSRDTAWKGSVILFKDINFENPLVTAHDDPAGVETFLHIRPETKTASRSSNTWKEFRIFSMSDEGESVQHCRGLVSIAPRHQDQSKASTHRNDTPSEQWVDVSPSKFYRDMHVLGNEYSGSFSIISAIQTRGWESRCRFAIYDVQSIMPGGHQQSHCLHPSTMEAALQCVFPALQAVGRLKNCTVLTSIDELRVSTDIPSTPGYNFSVQARADVFGPLKHSATLKVFSQQNDHHDPLIEVNGLIFTTLPDVSEMNNADQEAPQLCHELSWVIDITKTPWEFIVENCQRGAITVTPLHLRQKCDPFCRRAIREALSELSESQEQAITGDMRYLLNWMRSVKTDSSAEVSAIMDLTNNDIGAVGEAVYHMGSRLRGILVGDVNPLEVALEKDLFNRCYLDDDNLLRCHAQMSDYLQLARLKNPELRILEVGGGTGSLTVPLLGKLLESHGARLGSYVFTDVSADSIRRTKDLLEQWHSVMEFQTFDIEKDPESQGLELGSFDYIVASNVIHVTSSLKKTLCNLRTLLKPGGALVFVEITNPSLRWGIFGGSLPGWWLGVNDERESSPLLCAERWDEVLKSGGFSGLSKEMKDYDSAEDHEMSVLIAINPPPSGHIPITQKISIINTEQTVQLSNMLASQLHIHDDRFAVAQSHLSAVDTDQDVYIILPDLAEPSYLINPSDTEWVALQKVMRLTGTIVWVTCGAAAECSMPRHAMVTGLIRSLQAEKPQRRILTIDIDPKTLKSVEMAEDFNALICKLLVSALETGFEVESEYVIRNGMVLIPRLMPNNTLNRHVQDTLSDYHPRLEDISHSSQPLKLRIWYPGLLDTMYWECSQRDLHPLSDDEVQVAFEYIDTVSILADFGRFVEIGKRDLLNNGKLEMRNLLKCITFAVVDLVLLAKSKPRVFRELVQDALHIASSAISGAISPVVLKPVSEIESAFRLMQAGKHVGKLVLKLNPASSVRVQPQAPPLPKLRHDSSYLIVGGTGGLGRALIRHLTSLGAGQIITLSRSGHSSQEMRNLKRELSQSTTIIAEVQGSVSDPSSMRKIQGLVNDLPLRGIFQGAMSPKAGLFEDTTAKTWAESLSAKVEGTINLSESSFPDLDFFILLSSIDGIAGAPALSGYCASNTFLDAFARSLAHSGRPAISIDVGVTASEGVVAESEHVAVLHRRLGLRQYTVDEFLAIVNFAMTNCLAGKPKNAQIICGIKHEVMDSSHEDTSQRYRDPKFLHIYTSTFDHRHQTSGGRENISDIQAALQTVKTPEMAKGLTWRALRAKVAQLLVLSEKELHPARSVASYGMDSLVSVELQNWMSKFLSAQISSTELMSSRNMVELAEEVAKRSCLVPAHVFQT
ncbi:hypothetical protein BM1_04630 [Bipolaris maydis]|nr:hypothetical protein BM1_04630 [Bipolaris maydis]